MFYITKVSPEPIFLEIDLFEYFDKKIAEINTQVYQFWQFLTFLHPIDVNRSLINLQSAI